MSAFSPEIEVAVARLRDELVSLHGALAAAGAPRRTVLSGRVPGAAAFVITPAGVDLADVRPETLVLCDLDLRVIPITAGAEPTPAAAAAHAAAYRDQPAVGGVVAMPGGRFATAADPAGAVSAAIADRAAS